MLTPECSQVRRAASCSESATGTRAKLAKVSITRIANHDLCGISCAGAQLVVATVVVVAAVLATEVLAASVAGTGGGGGGGSGH